MKSKITKIRVSDVAKKINYTEFEKKLNSVVLSEKDKKHIVDRNAVDKIVEVALETLVPAGKIINKIKKFGDETEKEILEKKKDYLLNEYFKNTDNLEKEFEEMRRFISSPYGSMLYSKVISLVNNNSPNPHYIRMISRALRKVVNADFERAFDEYKYALDLIGRISVQALIILADCPNWPNYSLGNYSSGKGVVTSQWVSEFVKKYAIDKNILSPLTARRISHSLGELLRLDLIYSTIPGERDSKDMGSIKSPANNALCKVTGLGEEILTYIDPEALSKWLDIEDGRTG